jgi:uncharacterized membrane protein
MRGFIKFFKEEPLLFAMWLAAVTAYSLLSLFRHWHFQSSAYDLGIADQTVWHYSRLEKSESSLMGLPNSLGDHFSPLMMVLAPFYWIAPKVEVLLVLQAVLLMAPIFPIFLFTRKRLGRVPAYIFAAVYSILWGIQLAAQFDFHEVSLAVPLAAFAVYFMDEKHWKSFFTCAFLLMMVKEDMCLLTVFLGVYLITQSHFKEGLLAVALGAVGFGLEVKVLIPYFGEGQGYLHWSYSQLGGGPLSALKTCLFHPWVIFRILFSNQTKITTMLAIFAPFAMTPFLSPLAVLAVPLILERMLSDSPSFWIIAYHYTAVISPIITMAAVDGLGRISAFWADQEKRKKFVLGASGFCFLLNLAAMVKMPLRKILKSSYYETDRTIMEGTKVLGLIPEKASVLAQDTIVPHLSHRARIYNMMEPSISSCGDVDYVIACANLPFFYFRNFDDIHKILEKKEAGHYHVILNEDGWIVLKNNNTLE